MADDVRSVAIVHFTESLATGVLGVVRELANDSAARGIPTSVVHGRRPQTPPDVRALFHRDVHLVEVEGSAVARFVVRWRFLALREHCGAS